MSQFSHQAKRYKSMNEPRIPVDDIGPFASLLRQAVWLKEKIDALASVSGENFNIFTILDRETDEVKTHSAIIADLLNPNGLHGQGEVFVRLFLDRLNIETNGDLRRARVGVEVDVGEHGRIDVLFEVDNLFCVVTENKIHAYDQPRQLERYNRYATAKFADDRVHLLYLKLHGSEPDKSSLGSLPPGKVRCISYESDISGWLDACIREAARIPQIRELLVQYQVLLRKLTGRNEGNLIMALDEVLKERQGDTYNFELVPYLGKALENLRIEVEWQFWEDLRDRLEGEKKSRAWRLERVTIEDVLEVEKPTIERAHTRMRNRQWEYGWTFRVRPDHDLLSNESSEILLRVEHEGSSSWSWVFFGFLLVARGEKKTSRVTHDNLRGDEFGRKFIDGAAELNVKLDAGDWWLGWRYPKQDVSFLPETLVVKNGLMRRLIEKREAVVEEFATDVEEIVEAIVGS